MYNLVIQNYQLIRRTIMEQRKMLTKCKIIYFLKLFLCAVICTHEIIGCIKAYLDYPFGSDMMIFGVSGLVSALLILMFFISTTFFLTKSIIKAKRQVLANEIPITKIKGNYIPLLLFFVLLLFLSAFLIPMI